MILKMTSYIFFKLMSTHWVPWHALGDKEWGQRRSCKRANFGNGSQIRLGARKNLLGLASGCGKSMTIWPRDRALDNKGPHNSGNMWKLWLTISHDGSMVLLYMVCHGSHQYTPVMLALIYQHHGSVMGMWIMKHLHFHSFKPVS